MSPERPIPVLPQYGGACVRGIIPNLLGPAPWSDLPEWFPASCRTAHQIVLLVLDGLGWDQLQDHAEQIPELTTGDGVRITTVAPTTTATALSSIATGLTPGEHGLIGYRMLLGGEVLNVLRWNTAHGDRRRSQPPRDVQPFPPFMGKSVPVISPAELQDSAFTEAHLRGSVPAGWRAPSAIPVEIGRQLRDGRPFVYAYYGGVDKTAHERGFGQFYDAEVRFANGLISAIRAQLVRGAILLVTADHGQVHVGDNTVVPDPELLKMVALQSGEGRFRWWHANRGAAPALIEAATDAYGDVAWVVTREQTIDEGWFGPVVSPPVAARLGDVALVPHAPVSFHDPADHGAFPLICRHGSLTSAEVMVPLVAMGPPDG